MPSPRKITMGNWTYSKAFVLLYFAVMWPNQNVYGITKQDAARLKRRISEVQAKIDRLTLRVAHIREHTLSQRLPTFTQPHATTDAVGLWPLNARFGASDITGNGNDGTSTGTQLAAGPYGDADGAFLFSGTANSYIDIPNNGKLDVRYSFTILAHVYPTGEDGPIFDYVGTNPNTWYWALHFWQYQPHDLQLRDVSLRVYCHDMASEKPKEFLTLPSGPDENYAIFFGDRLVPQNMFQCTGPLQVASARCGGWCGDCRPDGENIYLTPSEE
uniref:GON domain-containing protein n=1 Tax=Branchiostoma floridae TaxID=7739 RepID=C3XT83_BRAFL|eukprot:XP_002612807.1 hypothetical protein BRAFLDRAFT_82163 [Branchiostoma floridae]